MSAPGHPAYFLERRPADAPDGAFIVAEEFAHLHLPHDGSLHLVIPPWQLGQVTKMGWGELHPAAAQYGMPLNVAMVYAPRTDHDFEVVCGLVAASWAYASGFLGGGSVLHSVYAARNEGDLERLLGLLDEDVLYEDRAWPMTMRGRDEVAAFVRRSEHAIADLRFEVLNASANPRAFGGEVMMRGRLREAIAARAAGDEIDLRYAVAGELRDGLITRLSEYYNAVDLKGEAASAASNPG